MARGSTNLESVCLDGSRTVSENAIRTVLGALVETKLAHGPITELAGNAPIGVDLNHVTAGTRFLVSFDGSHFARDVGRVGLPAPNESVEEVVRQLWQGEEWHDKAFNASPPSPTSA